MPQSRIIVLSLAFRAALLSFSARLALISVEIVKGICLGLLSVRIAIAEWEWEGEDREKTESELSWERLL